MEDGIVKDRVPGGAVWGIVFVEPELAGAVEDPTCDPPLLTVC